MQVLLVAALAVVVPCVLGYDEKYDKVDVDKIISDDSLFDKYLDCLLDKGPCEAEHSKDFRDLIGEVVATACAKCTPIQRVNVRKTMKAMQEKKVEVFKEFTKKFDPENKYQVAFAAFLVAKE